ncbi:MAG: AAA family ATPase [Chitinophagaceae bacterium]|nr:AAA family ATPase [Chitinophagaceae bacterium]
MEKEKGIYFKKLELENVRSFGEKAVFDLTDENNNWCRWNVILGDNGLGKTFLLQLLSGFEYNLNEYKSDKEIKKYHSTTLFKINRKIIISKNSNLKSKISTYLNNNKNVPSLSISANNNQFINTCNNSIGDNILYFFILGYGANRFMSNAELKESKLENSSTLFDDDAKLINAEEWLLQLDYAASRDSEIKEYAIEKRNKIKEVLIELLPDVTNVRFTEPTKEQMIPKVEFKTAFGWFDIRELSLGYKTMIAWVIDLAARMFDRYPDAKNPLAEPVVVLVDEIDLHLHPKWQRSIFDFLSDRFPNAQFIVTAHSPLVVQSAPKDANLILLKREQDNEGNEFVSINSDIRSVHNWRLDQIMTSDLFDIGARNLEIEKQLEERKTLLQKESLSEENKIRLEKLNELAFSLPTASNPNDIEAMEIIRKAAELIKNK